MIRRLLELSLIVIALIPGSPAEAQWVQMDGPLGGWTFSISHLGDHIVAGMMGGIFLSIDKGQTWHRANEGLPPESYVYSLAAHDAFLFAGTLRHGVFRSTDSGATWNSASVGLPNIFSARSLGTSDRSIFAPAGGHTYRSSDDGLTWAPIDTELTSLSSPQAVLTIGNTTYAAGNWIIQSQDDGSTWSVTAIPPVNTSWSINSLANLGNILVAYDQTSTVIRSTNLGKTWEPANTGLPSGQYSSILLTTLGTEIYAGLSTGVYRSSDSARTWHPSSIGLPEGARVSALACIDGELFAGYYGLGVFRSFDSGATWSECNLGIVNSRIQRIASKGDSTIVGTNGGVYLSTHSDPNTPFTRTALAGDVTSLSIDGPTWYAGLQGAGYRCLCLSLDAGATWSRPDSGLSTSTIKAVIHSGKNLIVGGAPDRYYGFFVSTDDGNNWSEATVASPSRNIAINDIIKFGTTLLAATNNYPYYSTDDGLSWREVESGIHYFSQVVVWAIGATRSKVFVHCTPNSSQGNLGIYSSDDVGRTWTHTGDTIFPFRGHVTSFASVGDTLFAAVDSAGIFVTTDGANHWRSVNQGLLDSNVCSLAVQGAYLLAGTSSSGLWRRPIVEMLKPLAFSNEDRSVPRIEVYPVPTSGSITILCPEFFGPTNVLVISETGGSVLRRSVNADNGMLKLDLSSLASGIYRVELLSASGHRSAKLVIDR